jgi:hypothetical protein
MMVNQGRSDRSRRSLAILVFLFVLGSRLGNWQAVTDDPANGRPLYYAVRGVPYSDAMAYELAAAEVSEGRDVMEWWRTRRQLWPYFLACFYTWTGPNFDVARAVDVGCSVATVMLLYLAVERLMGWPVAVASAIAMALDPNLQGMSLTLLSETFGLFLLAWHFERLVTSATTSWLGLVVSGIMLALSNVARSLTLFVVPFDMLALVLFSRRRGLSWLAGFQSALAFALGVAVVVGPYTYMQYIRTGIASMSDNMAMHLYCATSTRFPVWTHDVELVPIEAGINDTKGKYDFFMKGAKEQFAKDPAVFFRNVSASMVPPWKDVLAVSSWPFWPAVVLIAISLLVIHSLFSGAPGRPSSFVGVTVWGLVLAMTLWGLHERVPNGLFIFLMVSAVVRSLWVRDDESLWVTLLGGIVIITSGVFVYWAEDRLSIFLQPFAVILAVAGVRAIYRLGPAIVSVVAGRSLPCDLPAESSIRPGWRPFIVTLFALFIFVSGTRLVWARMVSPQPEKVVPAGRVSCESFEEIIRFAVRERPHLFLAPEIELAKQPTSPDADLTVLTSPAGQDWRKDGRLVVAYGHVDRHCYHFPKGIRSANGNRFFSYREYERSVFSFRGHYGCRGGYWNELAIFPGPEPRDHVGESYIVIGRDSYQPNNRYQEYVTELIMMLPYDADTGAFNLSRAIFADNPAHQAILQRLTEKRSQ